MSTVLGGFGLPVPLNEVQIFKNVKEAYALKGTDGMWAVEDSGTTKKGNDKSPYRNKVYVWQLQKEGKRGGRTYTWKQVGIMTEPGSDHGTTRTLSPSSNPFDTLMPQNNLSDQTTTQWIGKDGKIYRSVQGPGDLDKDIYEWAYKTDRVLKSKVPRDIKEVSESHRNAALDNPLYHPTIIRGPQPPTYDFATRQERAPQPSYNPFNEWIEHKTDSGEKYFFNPNTRETSWNKPFNTSFGRRRKRKSKRTRSRKRSRSRRRKRRRRSASRKRRRSRKKCHSRVRGHKRRSRRVRSHNRRRKCKRRKSLSFGYPVVSPADCVTRTFGTI